MSIAWTSLLHAVFEKSKINYYYRKPNSRFYIKTEDGEKKAWDLSESSKNYFQGRAGDSDIYENLKFVVRMRDRIEHRFMPALEVEVQGECQALLLNFIEILRREFSGRSLDIGSFSVPLQIVEGSRLLPRSKDEQKMIDFVKSYRNQLNGNVTASQRYAYKVFVMPQLGNHRSSSDLAVSFVRINPNDQAEIQQYENAIIAIKNKLTPVANLGLYRPNKVVETIHDKTGVQKTVNWHTAMWKKYRVRPKAGSDNPRETEVKYCQYDEAATTNDYVYTDDWVGLLIDKEILAARHG